MPKTKQVSKKLHQFLSVPTLIIGAQIQFKELDGCHACPISFVYPGLIATRNSQPIPPFHCIDFATKAPLL